MKVVLNRDKKVRIIIFFAYYFTLFSGLLHQHFATDDYANMFSRPVKWQLVVGRYSRFLIEYVLDYLNISLIFNQQFFMVLTIGMLVICSEILSVIFLKRVRESQRVIMYLLICLSLGNVFSTELYLFPADTLYNVLGIFLAIYSSYMFQQKSSISYVYCCLAMIASLGFYQANISIFLILCITEIILNRDVEIHKSIKQVFKLILISGISALFNILFNKMLVAFNIVEENVRNVQINIATITENMKLILSEQYKILIEGDWLLPQYLLLVLICCGIFFLIYKLIIGKMKLVQVIFILVVWGIEYLCVFAPHMISSYVWLSPRTITPFFIFIFSIYIYLLANVEETDYYVKKIINTILIVFLVVDFWAVQGIIQNHIATNKIDQEFAYCIVKEIEKYESDTGIQINYIAAENDEIPMWKNRFVEYYSYNVNERAYINEWSDVNVLSYVSGKNYSKVEMDSKIFEENFAGKNWDYYCPEEQLIFDGDTLYWCKY